MSDLHRAIEKLECPPHIAKRLNHNHAKINDLEAQLEETKRQLEAQSEKSEDQIQSPVKENNLLSRQMKMYKRLASTTHKHCEVFESTTTTDKGIKPAKISELANDLLCETKSTDQIVAAMMDLVDQAGEGTPVKPREQLPPLERLSTVEEIMDITLERIELLEKRVRQLKDKDDKFVNEEDLVEGGDGVGDGEENEASGRCGSQ